MIVYFLTDVMKWLRGKWNQLMKLSFLSDLQLTKIFVYHLCTFVNLSLVINIFFFAKNPFLRFLLNGCLKNKSDNGKLLLGKNLFR